MIPQHFQTSAVRSKAFVEVQYSSAIDFPFTFIFSRLYKPSKDCFRRRRTTNIPQTNEKDFSSFRFRHLQSPVPTSFMHNRVYSFYKSRWSVTINKVNRQSSQSKSKMAGQSVSGFNELATSTNSSDTTKRPGTPQITPSELSRPVNLQRIARRKAQIKTYPIRKKLEKLGVYSSCKASMEDKFTSAYNARSCWIAYFTKIF